MYEILGVLPSASLAELKAAHRRLSCDIISGKLGLSREDCHEQLQLIDVAFNTLSDQSSRDAYDMQQAQANQTSITVSAKATTRLKTTEGQAFAMATVVEDIYKANTSAADPLRFRLNVLSQTVGASLRSLKMILRIVLLLVVLGIVLRTGVSVLDARKLMPPPDQVDRAEGKLIVQEYFQKYGVRATDRAEVAALMAENRTKENERRQEEFKLRKADDEADRFISETQDKIRRMEYEQERAEARARDHAAQQKAREQEQARYLEMQGAREQAEARYLEMQQQYLQQRRGADED